MEFWCKECEEVIKLALKIGYRYITTEMYKMKKEIGKAIKGIF
jgi:diketogulonate reductase-like aldo/keto reductase